MLCLSSTLNLILVFRRLDRKNVPFGVRHPLFILLWSLSSGSPPSCRPECVLSSECPSHFACVNNKCRDPCPGSCGSDAQCHVTNHVPVCSCLAGYTGDPFLFCTPIPGELTMTVIEITFPLVKYSSELENTWFLFKENRSKSAKQKKNTF